MLYELKRPSDTTLAVDCLFPEAQAVIEGNNPGWVFVDDPNAPKAALVWAQGMDGFYLIGDANSAVFRNELDIHTEHVLKPHLRHLGVDWIEISGDEDWEPVIEKAFDKRKIEISQQHVYTLKSAEQKLPSPPQTAKDCRLLRIDLHLLANLTGSNKQRLMSKLIHFWGSADAFLNSGIGYVLMDKEEIASVCCSGLVAGNVHAIDIETQSTHRRKGYAETVARAYLAECVEKHLQPHWDCMAKNTASSNLAKKLGLMQSFQYTLYSFRY